jgi:Flp pilus assembly protein TadG
MNILKKSGRVAASLRRTRSSGAAFRRSKAGGVAMFVAVAVPPLILIGGLSVDQAYIAMRTSMLRRTAQSSALAAGQNLYTYYALPSSAAALTSAATSTALLNMPTVPYGTVVPASSVQIGTWDPLAKAFTATTTNPTAVRVTALNTVANGNPVRLFFGAVAGKPTVDISTQAVVGYGTGKAFNTIIVNDLSMSFSSEVAHQRAADLAILSCISGAASTTSQLGIIGFTGVSGTLEPLANAVTAKSAITTYVNGTMSYCGNAGMPACSGSNVAAGLYSATKQLVTAGLANSSSNIIVVTDGVPNADSTLNYTKTEGTFPTPTSLVPTCKMVTNSKGVITSNCTDANLWTMAQNQAAYAGTLGINVSTVYYSGDTTGATNQAAYATALQTLTTGTGVALVAPTAAQIDASLGAFCASMGSALKLVK